MNNMMNNVVQHAVCVISDPVLDMTLILCPVCLTLTRLLPSVCPQIAKLFSFTWTLGPVLCLGVHYIQTVTAVCSVLTLTAISMER